MAVHAKQNHPTGPEKLQRRINAADILAAVAVTLWLVTIALIIQRVSYGIPLLAIQLCPVLGLACLALGLTLRGQKRNQQWRRDQEQTEVRRHNDLVAQQTRNSEDLIRVFMHNQRVTDAAFRDVHKQLQDIVAQLDRKAWDIYSDAMIDLQGGPEVVNGETTQRFTPGLGHTTADNVVQLRRPAGRS